LRQNGVLVTFVSGLLLGGVLTALVLWLMSGLAAPIGPQARQALVIAIAALGVLRETKLLRIPLPQNARQIPQDVLQSRPRLGALQFGFELGTGVRTYVSSSAPYVLALGLVISHLHVGAAIAVGIGFGAGRALSASLQYWSRQASWNTQVATRLPLITNGTAVSILAAMADMSI
jgi:hypothetical protein